MNQNAHTDTLHSKDNRYGIDLSGPFTKANSQRRTLLRNQRRKI